jgi:cytochrome bd-type quinol oxidase subunit 2
MVPTVRLVRRRPPPAAIVAAVLGLLSCALPALFLLIGVALSDPDSLEQPGWTDFALPLVLLCGLVAGAVLLLLGRSWLALATAAGVLLALMLAARMLGGWGGGPFFVLGWVAPGLTLVLSALPGVRGWVTDRRAG